ncbi:hypothetical protein H5410_030274 [Solanum commersonii]|uniref:Helitron helicase-like domain-containing protein n=1 Tax=Solanum commersonii TaxID=4109 RepID=A0A9J5YGZ0_SOLCO|nr:hypothetical protein H5410_030274 [Solanum commersonii]
MSASSLKQLHSAEQHPIQRQDCLYQFELGSTSTANEHCNENTIMAQTSIKYHMLKLVPKCNFCGAKRFEYESVDFCCGKGAIKLISHQLPSDLQNLYLQNNETSKLFRTYIRTYNNMFAFTSLGANYDKDLANRNKGIYTFRVQGKMYHFIDDLIPSGERIKNLQLYYFDSENELKNRMACSDKLNQQIVETLMEILQVNPYSIFLKSLINIPQLSDFYIALKSNVGIWLEQNINNHVSTPHSRIYTKSDRSQLVHYYCGCYDSLQYPLLFPYGENGWHYGIKKMKPLTAHSATQTYCKNERLSNVKNMASIDGFLNLEDEIMQKGKQKRETVSCREYYCYKL